MLPQCCQLETGLKNLKKVRKPNLGLQLREANPSAHRGASTTCRKTADRWSGQPEVRKIIHSFRRRATDRACGIIARRATWASGGIAKVARD